MRFAFTAATSLLAAALAACGGDDREPAAGPAGGIAADQVRALEKAQQLEGELLDAAQRRKQQMEAQGQ